MLKLSKKLLKLKLTEEKVKKKTHFFLVNVTRQMLQYEYIHMSSVQQGLKTKCNRAYVTCKNQMLRTMITLE
jgi:hypothetical protein